MKIKTLIILFGLIILFQKECISQNYFITLSKDSVVCKQINFFDTNAQGKMIDIEYVNNKNEIKLIGFRLNYEFNSPYTVTKTEDFSKSELALLQNQNSNNIKIKSL